MTERFQKIAFNCGQKKRKKVQPAEMMEGSRDKRPQIQERATTLKDTSPSLSSPLQPPAWTANPKSVTCLTRAAICISVMLGVALRRPLRKLLSLLFMRPQRRQVIYFLRVFLITFFFLFLVAFITPVRNFVGYFVIPIPWMPLSSGRILQMFYLEEERMPVETGEGVTCDAVQSVMRSVNWQEIVSGLENLPAYDDQYYKHIVSNPSTYGATPEEIAIIHDRLSQFTPPMSALWQRELRMTFQVFVQAMKIFNVSFFLSEGTMLGAYRHHGIIPWDDDMDLCMNGTDWLKVKQILHCIPDFDVDTQNYMMYKFFWKGSELMKGDTFLRIPYIDIFFFTEDEEYLWALSIIKKHRIFFRKADIFPLTYRPFEGQLAPVPRTFQQLCNKMYDPTVCVSRDFDHFKNRPLIPFYEYEYHSCSIFKNIYPFVERKKIMVNGKLATLEILQTGKKVLGNFTVFHD